MKKIILISLLIFNIFNNLHSQVFQDWVTRHNGSGNSSDEAYSIAVDVSGNVYVTGYSTGSGTYDEYSTIKYNSLGVQQWVKTYNGPGVGEDHAYSIAVDSYGNVYVTGHSFGSGTNFDYATIKYNSTGIQQWVQRYNGPGNAHDYATAIKVDGSGNVYVTGSSIVNGTDFDYATIKYNSSGVQQWVQRYNGSANDGAESIAVDGSGNVYVTGASLRSGSNFDYATIKYNSSGVQQWVQRYNGPGNGGNVAYSIAVDDLGNAYVTGWSEGSGSNFDYATIKYNSSGVQQWVQRYNGTGNSEDWAYSLKVDGSGNVYVTGKSYGTGTDFDYATIKYNSSGVQQWIQRYNGTGNSFDGSYSLAIDGSENVYVVGESIGSGTNEDYAIIKYNSSGVQQWVQRYNGTGNDQDRAFSIAIDNSNNVFVTGTSIGNGSYKDYVTIKYTQQQRIVNQPSAYDKWISGEIDTIKWVATSWTSVNIKCILNFGTSQQSEYSIVQNYQVTQSQYPWAISDTFLSYKSKVIIQNYNDTAQKIESGIFRIKPYLLTRINSDSTYYEYRKDRDQWGFWNDSSHMWPYQWYQQFNYRGIDPFTGIQYSQWQGWGTFLRAESIEHPDWVSWVNTFTIGSCYKNISDGKYSPTALSLWKAKKHPWLGSCFGIAIANGLVFRNKNAFFAKYSNFPQFANPIDVQPNNNNVKKVINELFSHQFGQPHVNYFGNIAFKKTPNQTLEDIKSMLLSDNDSVRTLSFMNNPPGGGGHAVLAYKVTRNNSQPFIYYIHIYDNQFPNSTFPIIIYTNQNNGNGAWDYVNFPGWGGNKWIYLRDPVLTYLPNPTFNNSNIEQNSNVLNDTILQVYNPINASIIIKDINGNIVGYNNDSTCLDIPGSFPIVVENGRQTPPYGYNLRTDTYSINLNKFEKDTINTFFFTGNKTFSYERSGAILTQTDRLYFENGLSVTNPDTQLKTINLLNNINETVREKQIVFSSIQMAQNDSIKVLNPDSNKCKFVSFTSSKNYNVEINYVTGSVLGRFGATNITLPANSSHTIVPQWTNLNNSQLIILEDLGNNGTIDDTLRINNQIIGIEQQGENIPDKFELFQNYPNPFNPVTKIKFDIPKATKVSIRIYDILGREIECLVNEYVQPGKYSYDFNANNLSSGVYFYRLQAGDYTNIKKMVLLK